MPEGVTIEDRRILVSEFGVPERSIPIRVYRTETHAPVGMHILVHGGGWWQGSITDWISDVQSAERAFGVPCVVVTVEYRLVPEHPYPAGLDDVVEAVRWLMANAAELGADAGSVSLGGVSAGGNLAAAALLRLHDEGAPLPGYAVYEAGVFDLDVGYDSFERLERVRLGDGGDARLDRHVPRGCRADHRPVRVPSAGTAGRRAAAVALRHGRVRSHARHERRVRGSPRECPASRSPATAGPGTFISRRS